MGCMPILKSKLRCALLQSCMCYGGKKILQTLLLVTGPLIWTPVFSGSPQKRDKIRIGYITPTFSGVPKKGDKHGPCWAS